MLSFTHSLLFTRMYVKLAPLQFPALYEENDRKVLGYVHEKKYVRRHHIMSGETKKKNYIYMCVYIIYIYTHIYIV